MPRTKTWREVEPYVHSYDSSTIIVKHLLGHCMNGRNWDVSFIEVAISYGRYYETRDLEVSNLFWNIEWVPNGAKTVGYNGSTRLNVTSEGTWKVAKHDLWPKDLCKDKE